MNIIIVTLPDVPDREIFLFFIIYLNMLPLILYSIVFLKSFCLCCAYIIAQLILIKKSTDWVPNSIEIVMERLWYIYHEHKQQPSLKPRRS